MKTNSTLSIAGREVIKAEVEKQRANLGLAEFDRALNIALESFTGGDVPALTNRILDEVDALRSRFTNGSTQGTTAFWKEVAQQANECAKREILAGSEELAALAQLETEAQTATAKAKAKAAELDAQYRAFESLADNANRVNAKLAALKVEREGLDINKLNAAFENHYRALLSGSTQDRIVLDLHAAVIASQNLRLSIINSMESELQFELRQLQEKNRRLAKTLNLKKHDF
jgi:hypothetical protein